MYFYTRLEIVSLEIVAGTKLTQSETEIWLGKITACKNI